MTAFTPCHASVMYGALTSEIMHHFGTRKKRNVWLAKLGAVQQESEDKSVMAWILPDGAGVQFDQPAKLQHMQSAAMALAQHICGEIWGLEHGQEATQLEMANPVEGFVMADGKDVSPQRAAVDDPAFDV